MCLLGRSLEYQEVVVERLHNSWYSQGSVQGTRNILTAIITGPSRSDALIRSLRSSLNSVFPLMN